MVRLVLGVVGVVGGVGGVGEVGARVGGEPELRQQLLPHPDVGLSLVNPLGTKCCSRTLTHPLEP